MVRHIAWRFATCSSADTGGATGIGRTLCAPTTANSPYSCDALNVSHERRSPLSKP
jgi:hypothetical protein